MRLLPISKADMANIVVFLAGFGLYYTNVPIIRNIGGVLLGGAAIAYTIRAVRKGKADSERKIERGKKVS